MSPSPRKRAPQDRAEATKEKLLAATLSVILRDGWSGTSTLKICEEADVSNGAQTHHYPRKNDLLIAALKRNRDQLQSETKQRVDKKRSKPLSMREHAAFLGLTKRDEPYFYATLESLIAARTDESLRLELKEIDEEWIQSLRSMSRERVSAQTGDLQPDDIVELTLYLVRGMVVQRGVHQNNKRLDKMFALWCDIIERAVTSPTDP